MLGFPVVAPKWVRLGITSLEEYARHFNCVEGNTTLYALPKPEIVARWYEQTHDDFRFCFKFPATISHQAALRHCDRVKQRIFAAWRRWPRASASTGCSCRRRSVSRDLPALWHFLDGLPKDFTYGVEFIIQSFRQGKRNSSSTAGCTSVTSTA
ncbi:DUF72 domain-containing protein [Klebsiella pneumoniae]|nr:DUF72 domain-containing protein [Klebsiella pneumoniae]